MRWLALCLITTSCLACGQVETPPLPDPQGLQHPDPGFPVTSQPQCAPELVSAVVAKDGEALGALLRGGARMSCGDPRPLLDIAVLMDTPAMVQQLLIAGADPKRRWSSRGDRHALQAAIEARSYGSALLHRAEIVNLLLRHGADPNARWCPFETRGPSRPGFPGCITTGAPTALIMAACLGQTDTVALLLAAGASPDVEDFSGRTALDCAANPEVFGLLVVRPPPGVEPGDAAAVEQFKLRRPPGDRIPSVFQGLLTDAISTRTYGVARLALGAGADPNRASTSMLGTWTPLALATRMNWREGVELLLASGANPDGGR